MSHIPASAMPHAQAHDEPIDDGAADRSATASNAPSAPTVDAATDVPTETGSTPTAPSDADAKGSGNRPIVLNTTGIATIAVIGALAVGGLVAALLPMFTGDAPGKRKRKGRKAA